MSNQPPWAYPRFEPHPPWTYPGPKTTRPPFSSAWANEAWVPEPELTSLVRERITARRRSAMILLAAHVAALAVFIAVGTWYGFTRDLHLSTAETVIFIAPVYLLLWIGPAMAYWLRHRADHRLARVLRQRVAASAAGNPATVLRGWPTWLVALLYVSGLSVATGIASFATTPEDRTVGLILACGLGMFAVLGVRWAIDAVRRPAVANDEPSLRADDRMRRADLRWALGPYPVLLVWVAKGVGAEGSMAGIALSSYLVAASIVALIWTLAIPRGLGLQEPTSTPQRGVSW